MARENIRLADGNFTFDGSYYYTVSKDTQSIQQKVDDGSIAFSYPLSDSTLSCEGLEWDGVHFWSIAQVTDGASGEKATSAIVSKYALTTYLADLQSTLSVAGTDDVNDDLDSSIKAIAVEHYRLTVGVNDNGSGGYTSGLTTINVSDNTLLEAGDVLTFVRRGTSTSRRSGTPFVETATVSSLVPASSTGVVLTGAMSGDPHGDGKGFRGPDVDPDDLVGNNPPTPDEVYVTKYIWVVDNPGPDGTPSLYKYDANTLTLADTFTGVEFDGVNAATGYVAYNQGTGLDADVTPYNTTIVQDADLGGYQSYILLSRNNTLLFFNTQTGVIDRSMIMSNIKIDSISYWNVRDMTVIGESPNYTVYRLQEGTTYRNESLVYVDEPWSNLNYDRQLLRRVITSISIVAEPSVIPADGNSTSTLRAVLRDQYNETAPSGKIVAWADDSGGAGGGSAQGIFYTQTTTDNFGVTKNTYRSGTTEQDVKITASVENGLI